MLVILGVLAVANVASMMLLKSYNIDNGSMRPTIPAGSKVFVKPQPSYQPGDIVTFLAIEEDGEAPLLVTHRLKAIQPDGTFVTQGDANEDPDRPALPIIEQNVVGKVVWHVPYVGGVQMWVQHNWLLSLCVPLSLFTILILTYQPKNAVKSGSKPAPSSV